MALGRTKTKKTGGKPVFDVTDKAICTQCLRSLRGEFKYWKPGDYGVKCKPCFYGH
jgi:hypothetical protein